MVRSLVGVLWLWMWLTIPAHAVAPPDCSTPRAAADTLFQWLRTDVYDPGLAATCMELPAGQHGARLAVQLKQLLDARGIYFPTRQLPDTADYVDEDGEALVVPLPDELPEVTLVRGEDGLWRYSEDTGRAIPELYAKTFSVLSLWFQSNLPPVFYTRLLGLYLWQYLYALLLLAVAWAAGTVVRLLLRNQVRRLLDRARLPLNLETYRRTNHPIVGLVIFGVVLWGLPDLQLPLGLAAPLTRLAWIGLGLAGLVAAFRFISVGAEIARSWSALTESKLDDQAIPLLRQAAQLLLVVVGSLYLVDAMGFDVWKLAAGVGIGGLAFALAAQDTVANLFGSINIFLDRPFQIGDWVKIGSVEGVVEEVGFRSTRVRTFYNSLVTIPNSQITNANVDNLGLRPRRRIKFTLGLTYDTPPDKLEAFTEGVRAILAAHPLVQRSYEVHVYDLGSSAIEILVYYHVVTPDWHEELTARSQNILEFVRLAREMGVSFAFPSTSVYLESTPEHPLPPHDSPPLAQLREIFDSFGPGGDNARPLGPDYGRS
ncbi:MAG TPA: mechanosensitive ion channel family protein, partial [Deltaproteobacteria bacterium]|nr:mechanosensitive ion channel family protein [Deltaproteobacteria bacterium]